VSPGFVGLDVGANVEEVGRTVGTKVGDNCSVLTDETIVIGESVTPASLTFLAKSFTSLPDLDRDESAEPMKAPAPVLFVASVPFALKKHWMIRAA
jgi:hypothetical protein